MDWKALIGSVAPTLATALGGPLAGMAVTAVGNALGLDKATEDTVSAALQGATPADLLKVKEADQAFKTHMADLGVDLEKIAAGDRDSARHMQTETKSVIPGALAALITLGFFGILIGLMYGVLKTSDNNELLILLGALSTSWGGVVNFYFGSSASSARKDGTISAMAKG